MKDSERNNRNSQLIFLAPRFSQDVKGHFFDYAMNIANSQLPRVNKLIISEERVNSCTFDTEITWKSTDFGKSWGNDAGDVSPSQISQKLASLLNSSMNYKERNLVTFESSLSLFFALYGLLNKYPGLRIHFNFCDFGFWSKLLSNKLGNAVINFYTTNMFQRHQKQVFFYAQSTIAASSLSKYLRVPVRVFPFLSVMSMVSEARVTSNLRSTIIQRDYFQQKNLAHAINLLILPWPENHNITLEFLEFLYRDRKMTNLNVRVHSKNTMRGGKNYSKLLSKVHFSEGSLSDKEYREMFEWSDICYLPYSDNYHLTGNSGKLLDALCNGCYVIVDENTDLDELAEFKEIIMRTNHEVNKLSDLLRLKIEELLSSDYSGMQQERLSKRAKRQFSTANLYRVVSTANSTRCESDLDVESLKATRRRPFVTSWKRLRDFTMSTLNHLMWRGVWLYLSIRKN
jgi:hypothetical protein